MKHCHASFLTPINALGRSLILDGETAETENSFILSGQLLELDR